MARLARLYIPDCPQHIIQRGNNRQPMFMDARDYEAFLEWLRYACIEQKVAVHAYVLMPNHFHLLATPTDAGAIARTLQSVGRRYVRYFNIRYGRTGTLWEGRYRSTCIESERYLFNCARYIDLNPVRAGLVTKPEHYPWSSYRAAVGLGKDPLLTMHPLYWSLGNTPFEREAAYQALVAEGMAQKELDLIRRATQSNWALGSDHFLAHASQQTVRPVQSKPRGRPRLIKTVPN